MSEAFKMGGWGMFPTTIFGLLLVAAAIRYAMSPQRRYVPLQLALGVLTISAGGLGFVTGVIKSFEAIGGVEADKRWIWMLGVGESLHNVAQAFALIVIAGVIAAIGAARVAATPAAVATP